MMDVMMTLMIMVCPGHFHKLKECLSQELLPAPADLSDVARFLGCDVRYIPSPTWIETTSSADRFLKEDKTKASRLVWSMANVCAKVIEVGAGKSAPNIVSEYQLRVGCALTKKAKLALEDFKHPTLAPLPEDVESSDVPCVALVIEPEKTRDDESCEGASTSDVPCVSSVIESEKTGDDESEASLEVNSVASEEIQEIAALAIDDKYAVRERHALVSALLELCEAHASNRRHPVYRTSRAVLVQGVKASCNLNKLVADKLTMVTSSSQRKRGREPSRTLLLLLAALLLLRHH
jgi:hypothetical protein